MLFPISLWGFHGKGEIRGGIFSDDRVISGIIDTV